MTELLSALALIAVFLLAVLALRVAHKRQQR